MKRFISISLFLIALFFGIRFVSSCDDVSAALLADFGGDLTYLVCGYDDAAENTDVLVLLHYNSSNNAVSVIQIPRDTYYEYGTTQNKINQIFATERANGKSKKQSVEILKGEIEGTFDLEIDGYICVSTSTFSDIIDFVGGIDIYLPYDLVVGDLSLSVGFNRLTGEEALSFVRHRSSYLMGDVGRVDAQKIFLSGLLRKMRDDIGIKELVRLHKEYSDDVVNDIGLSDAVGFLVKNRGRINDIEFNYATIPGKSVKASGGVWYYSACRSAIVRMYEILGVPSLNIDRNEKLLFDNEQEFSEIYYSNSINPTIYDDGDLRHLSPATN